MQALEKLDRYVSAKSTALLLMPHIDGLHEPLNMEGVCTDAVPCAAALGSTDLQDMDLQRSCDVLVVCQAVAGVT